MTIRSSTGLRNAMLATGSFKEVMDAGSEIRVYAGTVPADADAAIGGATLLLTIRKDGTDPITMDAAASAGVLVKNPAETWEGNCVATGTPTFYRHVLTGDTGAASTTAPRQQGSCGPAGSDMFLTNSGLTNGAPQGLDYYEVALPA